MTEEHQGPPWAEAIGTAAFAILFMGTVVVLVPGWLTEWRLGPPFLGAWTRGLGVALILLPLPTLLSFLIRFVVEGRGTPAPFAPPTRLVTGGPFRRVRNPAYLCAVSVVLGQGLLLASPAVLGYALVLAAGFHLFVVLYEEPTLRRKFGADYDAYCRDVPRWFPRRIGGGARPPGP